jgi:hypothetical protein
MKKVFSSTSEVCHVWAQQKQSEGSAGNVFFRDSVIFSYGHHFPMAKFVDAKTVLFTTQSYSVSTRKHLSRAGSAIPSFCEVFSVHDVLATNHSDNVERAIRYLTADALKARRSRIANREHNTSYVLEKVDKLQRFIARFKVRVPQSVKTEWALLKSGLIIGSDGWKKYEAKQAAFRAEEKALREAQQKAKEAEKAKEIEKWKAGENVYCPSGIGRVFLRVNGEDIETSHGARIPVSVAKRLWHRINTNEPLAGMSLGHYTVSTFDGNTLKVGCHTIELSEIKRIAIQLGV